MNAAPSPESRAGTDVQVYRRTQPPNLTPLPPYSLSPFPPRSPLPIPDRTAGGANGRRWTGCHLQAVQPRSCLTRTQMSKCTYVTREPSPQTSHPFPPHPFSLSPLCVLLHTEPTRALDWTRKSSYIELVQIVKARQRLCLLRLDVLPLPF